MALPRARAAALLLFSLHGLITLAAILQSNAFSLANTSSSDSANPPILNISSNQNEYSDCFDPGKQRRGFYPAKEQDCLNAAGELLHTSNPFHPITFARTGNVGFKLPIVVRNGTCVISIDVMNDGDKDFFMPLLVYTTATDIAHRCTQGAFDLGGRSMVGPRKLVDVLVFGRVWPLENESVQPVLSEAERAVLVARERLPSGDCSLPNEKWFNLTERSVANTSSRDGNLSWKAPGLGGALECYDPPLPRERAWPINVKDCEWAADAIFGDRDRNQRYTFSRDPVATKFYYPLPASFRYRSCVVLLDMSNDSDQDTVRLAIVEATAWVLAHKCSGEERSEDQYGGRTTVGAGANHLIHVWVYGKLWPPPVGATNVTSLVLAQPSSLIDSE
ncbi:hypothetical protein IMSHALPRED_004972 [Imshaugia aleurites]|uniref:Uncharacterized protein n=1 Tax=Imshaugia aleurites TaxID=172621 RepID=A0A8H3F9X7_9LECA|nr:hypothetical protein IMSHALPRED_004972 [Imshaugia aleurites]